MAEFPAPKDGIVLTHFIVSNDIERSRRFYTDVLDLEYLRKTLDKSLSKQFRKLNKASRWEPMPVSDQVLKASSSRALLRSRGL